MSLSLKIELERMKIGEKHSAEARRKISEARRDAELKTARKRFWKRVVKTNTCWLWTGTKANDHGYGTSKHFGKRTLAHRVSWYYFYGVNPPSSLFVCHHCDNPSCVRPDHLFLGTPKNNTRDAISKGRIDRFQLSRIEKRGEAGTNSKLTNADVLEIRRLMENGFRRDVLARRFSVTQCTIGHIVRRRTWKHI